MQAFPNVTVAFFGVVPWEMIDRLSFFNKMVNYTYISKGLADHGSYNSRNLVNRILLPHKITASSIHNTWTFLRSDLLFIVYNSTDSSIMNYLAKLLDYYSENLVSKRNGQVIISIGLSGPSPESNRDEQLLSLQDHIANQSLFNTSLDSSKEMIFSEGEEIICTNIISSISGLLLTPHTINIDFNDFVESIAGTSGKGIIGYGRGSASETVVEKTIACFESQLDFKNPEKILIAISCHRKTSLDDIGQAISRITTLLPERTRIYWGMSHSPSDEFSILMIGNGNSVDLDIDIEESSQLIHQTVENDQPAIVESKEVVDPYRVYDDDMPEIEYILHQQAFMKDISFPNTTSTGLSNSPVIENISELGSLAKGESSLCLFNDGGLLLAYVPGNTDKKMNSSAPVETEPLILSGLLSAIQKMSGNLIGSELDTIKAGDKTCIFKKLTTDSGVVLNGVAIYDSKKEEEMEVFQRLKVLLALVDSLYQSSVSETCIKDRVDRILGKSAVGVCAF
ncbi:MAG: hypothetical protein ACTSRU_03005 [Candidatus Hodarchaeales archaeon]